MDLYSLTIDVHVLTSFISLQFSLFSVIKLEKIIASMRMNLAALSYGKENTSETSTPPQKETFIQNASQGELIILK